MPLQVHPHTGFESLFRAFGNPMDRSSLALQTVIIPTVQFAGYLRCRIAREYGICMGLQLLTPQTFIHTAVGPGPGSPWLKDQLQWIILPLIARYRQHLGVGDNQSIRDDFALAGLLADRLDSYGYHRPEWIEQWYQTQTPDGSSPAAEEWQIQLWHEVRALIGEENPHPAIQLRRVRQNPAMLAALAQRFPKLHVLAGGSLDPLLVEVLQLMNLAGCVVQLHVLLPALGYLADFARRRPGHYTENLDAEEFGFACGHPLLTSMGRHSIGTFALLERLDPQYTHWPEPDLADAPDPISQVPGTISAGPISQVPGTSPDPISQVPGTISAGSGTSAGTVPGTLSRLQSDIRQLRLTTACSARMDPRDSSIRIHSCFGPGRELEAVHDALLSAFAHIPDLRPEDVHLMVPDLDTYAPLAQAILGSGALRLPLRTTERTLTRENQLTQALLLLLDCIVVKRLQASDVSALLYNEAVQAHLQCDDTQLLRNWLIASGFTHGVGTDNPGLLGSARDRLVAGQWLGNDTDARYPGGEWILPEADELGGDFALVSRFCAWLSHLEHTFINWQQVCSAHDWALRIRTIAPLLLASDADELLELQEPLARLSAESCPVALDAGCIRDWLSGQIKSAATARNHSGSILMGRMNQLQHLPCRVLVIMGMDASFPGKNRTPSWDLLRRHPKIWDRNSRLDDRQQFLDALLTPTDRLIITAPNKNVRTAKEEPFSACVEELMRILPTEGPLLVNHRLQPFAREYFAGEDSGYPPSHSTETAQVATLVHRDPRQRILPVFARSMVADKEALTLSFLDNDDLRRFWHDPASAWLAKLNIAKSYQEIVDEQLDHQPLELDGLQSYKAGDQLIRKLLEHGESGVALAARDWLQPGGPLQKLKCWLQANRSFPPQNIGDSAWFKMVEQHAELVEQMLALQPSWQQVSTEIEGYGKLQSSAMLSQKGEAAWLYWRVGKFENFHHFLSAWIHALIAACAGNSRPTLLFGSKESKPKRLPPIPAEQAKIHLTTLCKGMAEGLSSPLAFGKVISWKLAREFECAPDDPDFPVDEITQKLIHELSHEPYNGTTDWQEPAFQLAWRGTDPAGCSEQWIQWSHTVALPLLQWTKEKDWA